MIPEKPTYEDLEARVRELEDAETEHRSIEGVLRESERRYRQLFMNSHAVMLLIDPASADIVDANPAAVAYYGWRRKELTAKKITDLNILSKEKIRSQMKVAERGRRNHFIFKHRLANGDVRDVEVFSGPIEFQDRQLLFSIIHDITERKQAEQALVTSRNYLDALFNATLSGTMVIDAKTHTITDVNITAVEVIGLPKEKIVGQLCHHFVCPAEQGKCPIADLGQVVDQSERILLDGKGEARAILKTVKALEIGDASFYIESFIDISARKRVEEERERLIAELQAAVAKVRTLSGLLPICASCKKIRDDKGYWNQLEGYIQTHSSATFSHGLCPDCAKKLYPDLSIFKDG